MSTIYPVQAVLDTSATVATAAPRTHQRIAALDFAKGALVLTMVLYHWLNYFVSTRGGFYSYLRFLTPSFIFISGFVISHIYVVGKGANAPHVPVRLLQRGLKILAVFIVLNVLKTVMIPDARLDAGDTFGARNLLAVFVTGNVGVEGNVKATAFNILVPISYVLMLSALLVVACRWYRYAFHAACAVAMAAIAVLYFHDGIASGMLDLVAVGLLGVAFGYVPIDVFRKVGAHRVAVAAAYAAYLAAIWIWDIYYVIQLAGVCLTTLVYFMIGDANGGRGVVRKHVVLLGQYSLFAYIAQIAVLQLLSRVLRDIEPRSLLLLLSFVAAFVLTSVVVEVADRMRLRVSLANTLYKAVFA